MARARQDSGEGNRAGLGERMTRGRRRSRRWSGDGGRAAAGGAVLAAEQRRQRKQSRACAREGRREERGSGDLFAKLKNYRDPSVN
jgi:hypothetical protein